MYIVLCILLHVLLKIRIMYRISQWKNTSTLWLHGFWSYDWADNYVRVSSLNRTAAEFVIDPATPVLYGK